MDETFEIIKAGAPDGPPEQALYRIQQTYPDGSGGRLNVDWDGLLRLHGLIHDRIALEGRDPSHPSILENSPSSV